MVITEQEVSRLEVLLGDIEYDQIPGHLATEALHAFLANNPHLLLADNFNEHEQRLPTEGEILALRELGVGNHVDFEQFKLLPFLRFQTLGGRWATLLHIPDFNLDQPGTQDLLFSCRFESVLREVIALRSQYANEEDFDEAAESEFKRWWTELQVQSESVKVSRLLETLRSRIGTPREDACTLWSPRIWLPNEQQQRNLVDRSLGPHITNWTKNGLCLQDLNYSEFEDLVASLLLEAGLKVYKVRESPQGRRDLIAKGSLIDWRGSN